MTDKKLTDKQKTELILEALKKRYATFTNSRCNVVFPELRLGSGYADIAQRRIDLFMISSEKGNYTTAFEIKASRGDFLKDIKDYAKQRGARLYSSNFYYVAPQGMIDVEEIPMWAGLLEYNFEENQFYTKIVAPLQSRNTPSWGLVCSIVRNINSNLYTERMQELENEKEYFKGECRRMRRILKGIAEGEHKDEPEMLKLVLNDNNFAICDIMLKK